MRSDYLAIVTLAFGEIARLIFQADWLKGTFGGAQGTQDRSRPNSDDVWIRSCRDRCDSAHRRRSSVVGSAVVGAGGRGTRLRATAGAVLPSSAWSRSGSVSPSPISLHGRLRRHRHRADLPVGARLRRDRGVRVPGVSKVHASAAPGWRCARTSTSRRRWASTWSLPNSPPL